MTADLKEASVSALCSLQSATAEFERRFATVVDFDWKEVEADKRYHGITEPWLAPNGAGRYRTFCGPFEKAEFSPITINAVGTDREALVAQFLKGFSAIFITPGSTLYYRMRPHFVPHPQSNIGAVYIRSRMTWGKVT